MSCITHYDFIAEYWDSIYTKVPYKKAYKFMDRLRKKHKLEKIVLDVACGTGTLLTLFEKNKYETFGNDLSPKMIEKAYEKLVKTRLSCSTYFHIHTLRKFPLIVSFFNSFAYCINTSELFFLFLSMRNILTSKGLLVFDIFLNPESDFKTITVLDTPEKRINRIFYGNPTSKGIYVSQFLYTILIPNKPIKSIIHSTERGMFTHERVIHTLQKAKLTPLFIKDNLLDETTTFVAQNNE